MKRNQIIKEFFNRHTHGRSREATRQLASFEQYQSEIMNSGGTIKNQCLSEFVAEVTSPPVQIGDLTYYSFACVLRECPRCKDKYAAIPYEEGCIEKIKYTLYLPVHTCT